MAAQNNHQANKIKIIVDISMVFVIISTKENPHTVWHDERTRQP